MSNRIYFTRTNKGYITGDNQIVDIDTLMKYPHQIIDDKGWYDPTTIFVLEDTKQQIDFEDPSEFLNKYFSDKTDWYLSELIFTDENWIGQQSGNDYFNVDIIEENNNYFCNVYTNELGNIFIAKFLLPETYQKFKTLLDIFLN